MADILDKIAAYKREEVAVRKAARPTVDVSEGSAPRTPCSMTIESGPICPVTKKVR